MVPIKFVPSTVPLFPNVLQPPAALILDQLALVPLVVKNLPLLPDCVGANALNAFIAVVCPVPPYAIGIAVPFHTPVVIVPKVFIEACPM